MISALKTTQIADRIIQQFQTFVAQWAAQVTNSQIVDGVLISATFPAADTDVRIFHNLGTQSVAWLAGMLSAAGSVYLSPNTSPAPTNSIILRASAPMTASLWFFEA